MRSIAFKSVFLFLAILIAISQCETAATQAASAKNQNFRRCYKAKNGQKVCLCGKDRVRFDRLKGQQCINGKVIQKANQPFSRLSQPTGLRLTAAAVNQSARDSGEIWRCTGLRIKPLTGGNEQAFVPLRSVSVEAWIDSFAADVVLTQVFVNREDNPIEAIYVFPIEENAAVYSFIAQIDDRTVIAELKEKKKAQEEYQSAVDQGQTAVLLQQSKETLDTFTVNIGALPPGKECRVIIQYVTELDLINDTSIRFVVPTTIAPRYNPSLGHLQSADRVGADYVQKTPYSMRFQAHVLRDEQYKIMQVANLSHPVNVSSTPKSIDVSIESIALDRDIILDIDLPANRSLTSVTVEKFNDSSKHAVLFAFTPRVSDMTKVSQGAEELNTEFIFIVDCSGSMTEDNRIGLAREAMLLFIRSLPVDSHFNIIRFGSRYEILFQNEGLTAVYNENTAKKAEVLARSMEADFGGTELLEPLEYLKKHPPANDRSRQIFLLTDGEISNTDEVIELCRSMSSTTRLFSFGLGHSPSRSLVKGLARATNGHFVFVPPGSKVDTYVGSQFSRALQPSFVNARLEWHGLSYSASQSPRRIPSLYVNDRVLVYALLESDELQSQNVSVDLVIGGHKISSIKLPENTAHKRDAIRRLAAKALIQELQHQKSNIEEDEATREQRITALSLNHQILSPYTAFVGVETTAPKINMTHSKVRHVPIQISKGDEHLMRPQFASYGYGGSGYGYAGSGYAYAAMPMAMASIPRGAQRMKVGARTTTVAYGLAGPSSMGSGYAMHDGMDASQDSSVIASSLLSSDPVRWLIDQQSFNGAWVLNEEDIKTLTNGKSLSAFQSTLSSNKDALTTALAVAILESKHTNQQTLWSAVVAKGRKRLSHFGLTDDQINVLINQIKSKL